MAYYQEGHVHDNTYDRGAPVPGYEYYWSFKVGDANHKGLFCAKIEGGRLPNNQPYYYYYFMCTDNSGAKISDNEGHYDYSTLIGRRSGIGYYANLHSWILESNNSSGYVEPTTGITTRVMDGVVTELYNGGGRILNDITIPIFDCTNSWEAVDSYIVSGDDSGADNYEDLHPMQYTTTVWMDGKYPNLYWKTEVGEEATPETIDLTCEIYATPLIQAVKTFNNQYSLNSMQYVQYSDYASPTKVPSIGGGTQPTPYVFYVNPLDNTDTDYDAQITFYVNDDGTVSNISIQSSAKHTIIISDEPTPSDSDYPDEQTNFNHDMTTSFQDGTSVNTLTTTYRISTSQLRALGNFLWSNTFKDGILGLVNYPLENIVSLKCMPVNLGGTDTIIKIGNVDTGIHGDKCDYRVSGYQAYVGSCTIKKPFNNFMDYTDVELSIYLPFIGYKPLDAVMVMGRKIELTYIYDCVLGNCMAVLYVYDDDGNRIMFDCHQGTCGIDIAITSTNRADIENGMINSVLSGIGHLASAVSGNAVGGVLGVAGDVFKGSTQGFHTQSTGVGNPSLMTKMDTTAFVILKRPQIMDVDGQHYGHHYGYPCNLYKKLKNLSGFTQTKDFVCSLINKATDEEKAEIESLLNSGIYIM